MTVDAVTPRSGSAANDTTQPGDGQPPADRAGVAAVPEAKRITPRSPRTALEPDRLPEPARYSKRARHPLVIAGNAIITILLLVGIVAAVGTVFGKQRFEAAGPLDRERIVNIPRGGLRDIAEVLQREGVIDQPWLFVAGVIALRKNGELKYGEYLFPKQVSMHDVVEKLIENKVVDHFITIPEGLTSDQIVARLKENDVLAGTIKDAPREGTLLPETYKFNRGDTREQVVQRMQQRQKRVLQEAWERRTADLPIKTPEQLVVLASIIEKETGRADERTRVAAVFINRLRQRMRLQSDPTIIYGLVGGKGTLGRPIQRNEIDQATPYNTYVIEGLPPGPIANPGRAALEAAANPSRTRELYFVADGTGGHVFAETLDQHQRNVAKLRLIEQQQRQQQQQQQQTPGSDAAGVAPTAAATPPVAPPVAPAPQRGNTRTKAPPKQ
jgi:UPF0755 protein